MNMIKKLRRQFILVATAAVFLIIVGALSLINAITYVRMENEVQSILSYISQNDGYAPPHTPPPTTGSWLLGTDDSNWASDTPEFTYQTRFFSVHVNAEGYASEINITHIAAFTETEAIQYARTTVAEGKPQGFFKKNRATYAYQITKHDDGSYLIVILDCTRDVAAVQSFMRYSAWFGFACIVLYVLILIGLCNWAIKPFVRNMENQKRFITNAGHELKTPIAIISANAEAIELINGKSQWTTSILHQVRRVSNLINDLIMLAKMSEGSQLQLTIAELNVSAVTHTVAESFRTMAEEQHKLLTEAITPDIMIKSDEKCFYELINILIDNAVKYCDDNGEITVRLTPGRLKKGAVIAISNTYAAGEKIDYSRFFERFYRGDESHNSQKSGYGIGLSMAEELTHVLKGKISVSYKKGIITFTVQFS